MRSPRCRIASWTSRPAPSRPRWPPRREPPSIDVVLAAQRLVLVGVARGVQAPLGVVEVVPELARLGLERGLERLRRGRADGTRRQALAVPRVPRVRLVAQALEEGHPIIPLGQLVAGR